MHYVINEPTLASKQNEWCCRTIFIKYKIAQRSIEFTINDYYLACVPIGNVFLCVEKGWKFLLWC